MKAVKNGKIVIIGVRTCRISLRTESYDATGNGDRIY